MFTIGCVITTAIVSVWGTAVVRIAVKNWALERAIRTSTYWQQRARQAEAILEELAEQQESMEDHSWWGNDV